MDAVQLWEVAKDALALFGAAAVALFTPVGAWLRSKWDHWNHLERIREQHAIELEKARFDAMVRMQEDALRQHHADCRSSILQFSRTAAAWLHIAGELERDLDEFQHWSAKHSFQAHEHMRNLEVMATSPLLPGNLRDMAVEVAEAGLGAIKDPADDVDGGYPAVNTHRFRSKLKEFTDAARGHLERPDYLEVPRGRSQP